MQDVIDIIGFGANTGLDSDIDISKVETGDSPVDTSVVESGRLNVEYLDGKLGVVSNAKGNELETKTLPAGTNTILGWCGDRENNAIIYFVYNSNNDHCIIRYKHDGSFENISYAESAWAFNINYPITDAGIIGEGQDAQLCWTDDNNEPRKIKISSVENGDYAALNIGNINTMKPIPLQKPSIVISDDTDHQVNNITGYIFQFAYRYIYDANEKSNYTYSDLIFNYKNEFPCGFISSRDALSNRLDITVYRDYANVEKVELVFRYGDVGGGVFSKWFYIDTIDVYQASHTYNFYHDKHYSVVLQEDFLIPYYDVPRKAGTLSLLNNNILCLGKVTKDYDNLEGDYSDPSNPVSPMTVTLTPVIAATAYTVTGHTPPLAATASVDVNVIKGASESYHRLYISLTGENAYEKYVLGSDYNKADTDAVIDFFIGVINAATSHPITASRVGGKLRLTNAGGDTFRITWNTALLISENGGYDQKTKSLIPGSYVSMAIQYYDNHGRSGRCQVDGNTTVYVRTFNEKAIDDGAASQGYSGWMLQYEINHLAPTWATHYRWMYGGCSIPNFYIVPIVVKPTLLYNTTDLEFSSDYMKINISAALSRANAKHRNNNIETFSAAAGDKVRIIGGYSFIGLYYTLAAWDEVIELDILKIDANGAIIVKNIEGYDNADEIKGDGTNFYLGLAIYSVSKGFDQENVTYKEVGQVLDITNRYHEGAAPSNVDHGVTARNQTDLVSAIGVIDFGVGYRYPVEFFEDKEGTNDSIFLLIGNCFFSNASLLYKSKNYEQGKLSIVDKQFKEKTFNAIMWGGTYSDENLNYNELNKFHSESISYLDDKHGEIHGLEEEGYTLNIIQRSKVTSAYVNVVEQLSADGTPQYLTTRMVIGSKRPLLQDWGTVFPFSIVRNKRFIYFFDIYNAIPCRKAPNGLEDISFRMKKYFRDKCNTLLGSGISNISVYSGWDPVNNLYILTFIDSYDSSNNETVAFHEPTNRWITFYSFKGVMYANIGETIFLSFTTGAALYKHNSDSADRNSFYGSAYSSKIKFLSNKFPDVTKRFNNIYVDSNDEWGAPDDDSIVVNPDAIEHQDVLNYTKHYNKMQSELPAAQFRYSEGGFVAEFLRDSLTTTGSPTVGDLINGRALVGKEIQVQLENGNRSAVYLKLVKIYSSTSDL